jgi:hypothetical protein
VRAIFAEVNATSLQRLTSRGIELDSTIFLLFKYTTRSKPCKKTEVRKITSLKTSPEVGKITSLITSPKETNLVKKNCEVRKITSMEKTSPKETTLVKKSSVWPRETSVRVGVFVIPTILLLKKKEQRLRHKNSTGQVLEAIAVSLMMTHGRVETPFLTLELSYKFPPLLFYHLLLLS